MKKFYIAAACLLMAQPALGGAREDARAAEQRCSAMPDDRSWLDCSYGALQIMRAKLGLTPAPEFQQRLVPPAPQSYPPTVAMAPPVATTAPPPAAGMTTRTATVAPAPVHRRGSFMQILGGTAPPVAVSPLAAVRYDNRGAFIVTLENGQVWRQTDVESGFKPHFRMGEKIVITPGAMWSYNLKTEDDSRTFKVGRAS